MFVKFVYPGCDRGDLFACDLLYLEADKDYYCDFGKF